ncbi:MAG TPA: GtrA family protein [Steroidobacteraceae bacterium]|jgi:putative flippase GtrA|nr:GtrA family protein [Steroidobacteraceae bacterium]
MVKRGYELVRYGVVGLLCFALGLALPAGLHEYAQVNYLVAFAVSFVLICVVGYFLNAHFTFAIRKPDLSGATRYTLVNLVSLALNLLALKLLVENAHLWYLGATVLLAAVNAPIGFVVHRLISYRIAQEGQVTDIAP